MAIDLCVVSTELNGALAIRCVIVVLPSSLWGFGVLRMFRKREKNGVGRARERRFRVTEDGGQK